MVVRGSQSLEEAAERREVAAAAADRRHRAERLRLDLVMIADELADVIELEQVRRDVSEAVAVLRAARFGS